MILIYNQYCHGGRREPHSNPKKHFTTGWPVPFKSHGNKPNTQNKKVESGSITGRAGCTSCETTTHSDGEFDGQIFPLSQTYETYTAAMVITYISFGVILLFLLRTT